MAEEIGVSSKTMSRYYNGESSPKAEIFYKLAQRFGCTIEELLTYDFQNTNDDSPRPCVRRPGVTKEEFKRFEGIILYAYYLKESSTTDVYEGEIRFDMAFDERRLFLHGYAETGHNYDLKLVLEDHDSIFIYGTEITDDRRFFIALHYPDFRKEEKYKGGVGILTRLDVENAFEAQRVVLSDKKIKTTDMDIKNRLLKLLSDDKAIPRVWVNGKVNNDFRSGNWMG